MDALIYRCHNPTYSIGALILSAPRAAQILSSHLGMYCIYLNPLYPSDLVWQPRSGWTLARVMACSLMVPSHFLNQCWLFVSENLRHSPGGNFTTSVKATILYNEYENHTLEITATSPRGQLVHSFAVLFFLGLYYQLLWILVIVLPTDLKVASLAITRMSVHSHCPNECWHITKVTNMNTKSLLSLSHREILVNSTSIDVQATGLDA